MSWQTGSLLWARERFVRAALTRQEPFSHLCRRFQISRSAGYKWWRRFLQSGQAGLQDRPRRPRRSPRQMKWRWQAALRRQRRYHPTWGGRKLRARLRQLHPRVRLPAARTLGRWLQRWQLVPRRRRHQRQGPRLPPRRRTAPRCVNDVWTIDFKGWFRTRDGTRVEPLTVRDLKSRFLLLVCLLPNQSETQVRRALQRGFRRYGLPKAIWTDNGPPFGGVGPLGYSRLAVWWRRLGIRVEYSRPAAPQDNAAHEQMHGVYQREVAAEPATRPSTGQRQTDRWRKTYNQIRSHEALQDLPPARRYRPSHRKLPPQLPAWTYPEGWLQKPVSPDGRFFWGGRQRFIGRAFGEETIGLRPHAPGVWQVYLGAELLGVLHQSDHSRSLRPAQHRRP